MKRSESRILTTHIGSLVRPPQLLELMQAKERAQPYDQEELAGEILQAVREVVRPASGGGC